MSKEITIDRYPGLRPFDEVEKKMFFGRFIELEELCHSINVNDLFVIHGESGLGKSSLINAGLIPLLKEKNFYPILLRFKDRNKSPLQQVLFEVRKMYSAVDCERPEISKMDTLWKLIKLYNKNGVKPILIFDQFEEFSYFKQVDRIDLIKELSVLQAPVIPEYGKTDPFANEESKARTRTAIQQQKMFSWHSQVEVKLIFSLRSDRISILEEFATQMPGMMRARYQLKPILLSQAEQIIVIPAVSDDEEDIKFTTQPFQYDPQLIPEIIETVSDTKRNTIETTQLQMICQEIELIVKEKQKTQAKITITKQDIDKRKLKELVNNFYKKQIEKISNDTKISKDQYAAIRILVEKRLLIQKSRIPLAESAFFQFFTDYFREKGKPNAISPKGIQYIRDLLLSLRLIRDQNYGGVLFYEISHDTLIEPIEIEKNKREAEEKQEKANEEKKKKEREIEKQRKHIKAVEKQKMIAEKALRRANVLQKWVIIISGIFVIVVATLLVYYVRKSNANKGMLVRIYNNEADKNYEFGNQVLAYKYWSEAAELSGSDSLRNSLKTKSIFAFAGTSITASIDFNYIALNGRDRIWHIWRIGENEATHITSLPPGLSFGFISGKNLYWTKDDSSHIAIYKLGDLKKIKFAGESLNLDSLKIGVTQLPVAMGNYLKIITYKSNKSYSYFFSIETGKPLNVINRYIDMVVKTHLLSSQSFIPANSDSSVIFYQYTGSDNQVNQGDEYDLRESVLMDLKNDKIIRLEDEPVSYPVRSKDQIAYGTMGNITVYNTNSNQKRKIRVPGLKDKIAKVLAFVNSDSDLLFETYENFNYLLYQVNINSGEVIKLDKYSQFMGPLKDRYCAYVTDYSVLNIYDSERKKVIHVFPGIYEARLSPNRDKVIIDYDSLVTLVDPFTFKKEKSFPRNVTPIFSDSSSLSYTRKDTLFIYNYYSRKEVKITLGTNGEFSRIIRGKFYCVFVNSYPYLYYVNFIDSTKRNPIYLQRYFKSYIDAQFQKFNK